MSGTILAAALMVPFTVFAWGPREQGALAGFIGGYIIGQQNPPAYQYAPSYGYVQPPAPYIQRPPRQHYAPPPPTYYNPSYGARCWTENVFNSWGQLVNQRTVCQ